MCMPHHIQTLARTCALALVCICAWICLCAGMSTSASATTLTSTRDIQSLTGIQNARSTTRANIFLDAAATPAADTTISRIEVHSGTAIVSLTPPTSSGSSGLEYYQSTCSAAGQPTVTSRSSAASNSVCCRRRQNDPCAGILLTQPKTLQNVAYARFAPNCGVSIKIGSLGQKRIGANRERAKSGFPAGQLVGE